MALFDTTEYQDCLEAFKAVFPALDDTEAELALLKILVHMTEAQKARADSKYRRNYGNYQPSL